MPLSRSPASPDPDPRPIIWAVSATRLSRLLNDVIPEFDAVARIEPINLGFEEAARRIRTRLLTEQCDALIAAGSNGAYLKNRVPKPVVILKASGFDLMQALARARKVSDRIGVITHLDQLPEFAEFQDGFGLEIEQRSFVTVEDARDVVAEFAAKGIRVIVGTGMATELAEEAGMTGILLYSANSIRTAFESALDIARASRAAAPRGQRRAPPALQDRGGNGVEALVGTSEAMQQVRDRIRRYAASDSTVLVTGETGTGKELVARAVHAESARRKAPFIAVNCGALAETLLESELFGHDEGAFTGARRGGRIGLVEAADGGTLFLDEIGEMPLALQTRLLRVLEQREVLRLGSSHPVPVNLRVVAATNIDLSAMVAAGRFRRDLYYRLDILRVALPRLAERSEDIPLLIESFLNRMGQRRLTFSTEALLPLLRHRWPGNVRELFNLVERIAADQASTEAKTLSAEDLRRSAPELFATVETSLPSPTVDAITARAGESPSRRRPSAAELRGLLKHSGGQRGAAAAALGVSRSTLWRWLQEDGI